MIALVPEFLKGRCNDVSFTTLRLQAVDHHSTSPPSYICIVHFAKRYYAANKMSSNKKKQAKMIQNRGSTSDAPHNNQVPFNAEAIAGPGLSRSSPAQVGFKFPPSLLSAHLMWYHRKTLPTTSQARRSPQSHRRSTLPHPSGTSGHTFVAHLHAWD